MQFTDRWTVNRCIPLILIIGLNICGTGPIQEGGPDRNFFKTCKISKHAREVTCIANIYAMEST